MKIVIGICFIVLVCSVRGDDGICKATGQGLDICETSNTTITLVRKLDPSFLDDKERLVMKFYRDTIISTYAFIKLDKLAITSVCFEMPSTTERNKSALHTLALYPYSFVGLSNAYEIIITYANINLYREILFSIMQLKKFGFVYCGFSEVPTEMLKSTPYLVELSLEGNYIHIIRSDAFSLLTKLEYLYLQNNDIISLELGCFNGLDNLKLLGLSGNHFAAVPSVFNGLTKLRHLYIENVSDDIEFILNILQNLPVITDLLMGSNNITFLKPDMFDIVPHLKFLSLSKNQITNIPKGVFNKLKSLNVVHLAHNHIKTIEPDTFSGLNSFPLHLSDNVVDKIIETGTFSNLTTEALGQRKNNITELKARVFDGLSVILLDLSNNKLKQIAAEDFVGLETEELDLSANEIETIAPNAFKNTKVERLHLGGNPVDIKNEGNWGLPESTKY